MAFDICLLHKEVEAGDILAVQNIIRQSDTCAAAEACIKAVSDSEIEDEVIGQALDQFVNVHATERHNLWVKHAGYLMPLLWEKDMTSLP